MRVNKFTPVNMKKSPILDLVLEIYYTTIMEAFRIDLLLFTSFVRLTGFLYLNWLASD